MPLQALLSSGPRNKSSVVTPSRCSATGNRRGQLIQLRNSDPGINRRPPDGDLAGPINEVGLMITGRLRVMFRGYVDWPIPMIPRSL